jgi:thiamine biosynthesis lipoprotein
MSRLDERFECMGCRARLLLSDETAPEERLRREADDAIAFLHRVDAALSRFRPDSELSRLNRNPFEAAPATPLLRALVRAGRWAGRRSHGLVDFTLLGEIEAQGYVASRAGVAPAPLAGALAAAPPRRPAGPSPAPGWRHVRVDADGLVRRPRGLRVDSGGLGKGLAVDLVTTCFSPEVSYVVSLGGDLLVGGPDDRVWGIGVEDARSSAIVHRLPVAKGGVATSGIHARLWERPGGGFAHHVLDPATGEPAWTGLVAATAVGANGLDAELLAKVALLSGPRGAPRVLRRHGGVLQHDDGRIEVVPAAPRVRLAPPTAAAA